MAITIADTIVSNNGQDGVAILRPPGSTGVVTASLERVTAISNGNSGIGLDVPSSGTIQGTLADRAAIGNLQNGFLLTAGAGATIALVNSQAIGNGVGLFIGFGIVVSRVTLAGNTTNGFNAGFESFGDNYIIDTNNSGT